MALDGRYFPAALNPALSLELADGAQWALKLYSGLARDGTIAREVRQTAAQAVARALKIFLNSASNFIPYAYAAA